MIGGKRAFRTPKSLLALRSTCLLLAPVETANAEGSDQFPDPHPVCVPSPYGCPGDSTPSPTQQPSYNSGYDAAAAAGWRIVHRAQELNREGIALLNNKNYIESIIKFRQALRLWDNNTIKHNLAVAEALNFSQNKEYRSAYSKFIEAMSLYPINNELVKSHMKVVSLRAFSDGLSEFQRGNYQKAKDLFGIAAYLDDSQTEKIRFAILVTEAMLFSSKNEFSNAERKFEAAQRSRPMNSLERLRREVSDKAKAYADELSARGNERQALEVYRVASRLSPNNTIYASLVKQHEGRVLFMQKDFDGAVNLYTSANNYFSDSASIPDELSLAQGMQAIKARNIEEAGQYLFRIESNRGNSSGWVVKNLKTLENAVLKGTRDSQKGLAGEVPPPLSDKDIEIEIKRSNRDAREKAFWDQADLGCLLLDINLTARVASKGVKTLSIALIGGRLATEWINQGLDEADVYVDGQNRLVDDAISYLNNPAQKQRFANTVEQLRESRPIPGENAEMIPAARAILERKGVITVVLDKMMSAETREAMLRKISIEAAFFVSGEKAQDSISGFLKRTELYNAERLNRRRLQNLLKWSNDEKYLSDINKAVSNSNSLLERLYRYDTTPGKVTVFELSDFLHSALENGPKKSNQ